MGRTIGVSNENKNPDTEGFPRLKLKQNEKARIVCLEDPYVEFVHDMRAPKIINGQPASVTKKRKDGSEYTDYDYEFFVAAICLGDDGILEDKGSDPQNCPACEAASNGDSVAVAQRRFAMHVIQYAMKQGSSSELLAPFSVSTKVWRFSERVFNKLIDITNDLEEGDKLAKHDLLLGPCTSEQFQQFDISASTKAVWLSNKENAERTKQTFRENRTNDLASQCGTKTDRNRMLETIVKIKNRWAFVNRFNAQEAGEEESMLTPDNASLADGLSDLLNDPKPNLVDEGGPDIMADLSEVNSEPEPESVEASMPKPGSSGEELNMDNIFDDLLKEDA